MKIIGPDRSFGLLQGIGPVLCAFKEKTGCPVLVKTSFCVRGESIAHTPEDMFRCLMGTGIEMLVIGNCVLH